MKKEFLTDKMIISSNLEADFFGKSQMANNLGGNGVFAEILEDKIEFSQWHFSQTKIDENKIVWFCGDIFENSKSVFDIFEEGLKSQKNKNAILNVIKVLDKIIEENIEIEDIGGGGIFVSDDLSKILIIPGELFEHTVSITKDFAKKQGFYIYKGLDFTEQTIFTRAVICYKALTNEFPYKTEDMTKRQIDILYNNFTPLIYSINGINENFANTIDSALSLPLKSKIKKGEERYKNKKAEIRREKLLENAKLFNINDFKKELFKENREKTFSDDEFQSRLKKFKQTQENKIKKINFLQKHKTKAIAIFIILLFFCWGIATVLEARGKLATTISLTSTETVHVFYSLTHKTELQHLNEVAKGKEIKPFIKSVTMYYVSNKGQGKIDEQNTAVSIEEWLRNPDSKRNVYGITKLKIDGTDYSTDATFPLRNEKKEPLLNENGVELQSGNTTSHLIEYFFIATDEENFNISKYYEKIITTWDKNRWVVTKLERDEEKSNYTPIKRKDFENEYQSLLSENKDIEKSIEILKKKYNWIP